MPTETLPERTRSTEAPEIAENPVDEAEGRLPQRHLAAVRKFRVYLSVYLLSLVVLTPVWVVTQYYIQDGWPKHLSTRSRYAGDWDPWIIWVALVGAVIVGIMGYRAYVGRDSETNIRRELER